MQTGVLGHNSIKLLVAVLAAASSAVTTLAQVGEGGHFYGGVKGVQNSYDAVYNYDSFGERLHNDNWQIINFASVSTPYGPVPFSISVDVNLYALVPAAIWISPYTVLGAEYGGYVAPVFANHSFGADLFSRAGGPGLGDFNAHAVWLDWAREHWDFSLTYGFHAPAGYGGRIATLHGGVEAPMEATDKLGLGYSAQHARAGVAWYPMTNKATAVTFAWTYEYNHGMEYFDVRPGQMFTVSWGVSQYVPLRKNRELLLEVGPAGYDTCQITDSTGGNALADAPKSHIHALGGELGLTYVPWNAFLTFRSFYEYAADSRFQGAAVGFNFGIKF